MLLHSICMGNNLKLPEDTGKSGNIHKGHRQRMRERYAENGLDGFQTHEVLEMLLFRSIVQGNTNPIAHAFLDKCGSMESVLEGNDAVPGAAEKTLAAFVGAAGKAFRGFSLAPGQQACRTPAQTQTVPAEAQLRTEFFQQFPQRLSEPALALHLDRDIAVRDYPRGTQMAQFVQDQNQNRRGDGDEHIENPARQLQNPR